MRIVAAASFSPIVADPAASRTFYADFLGLNFEGGQDDYLFTEQLAGNRHFGLWPLSDAARACYGTAEWPDDVPVPQASLEFEVESPEAVAEAERELRARGLALIHGTRTEPWNQTIARVLSPERLIVGVCYTPWQHDDATSGS